jgi:hemoglobin
LFERLGGIDAITAVVDTFIGKSAADTRINKKFAKSNIERLRFHLIEQVCSVTGGPCDYTGRDMSSTHRGMGVTDGEFDALVENLVATLNQFNVPEAEKNELLAILGPLRGSIVETAGTATGTPLPAAFKPAAPLPAEKLQAGPIRR